MFDVLRDGDTVRPGSNSELIQASPKFEFESVKIIHNDVKILKMFCSRNVCAYVCAGGDVSHKNPLNTHTHLSTHTHAPFLNTHTRVSTPRVAIAMLCFEVNSQMFLSAPVQS